MAKQPEGATLDHVVTQLRISNRLLAMQLRERFPQAELIQALAQTGAAYAEIAVILGTTAPTVSNAIVRSRRAKRS